ncbi:MAG: NAD(P)-binding protein, partial [Chloroflexi bacterium]|nr:NAD(P)-binding protein [Chloroflexota bacterium]
MYHAIVIGAGVAGNYVACRLASQGYKVLVLEEHEQVGEPVQCTGLIGAECFNRFPLFEGTVLREVNSAKL